jgi:hypothetical protein
MWNDFVWHALGDEVAIAAPVGMVSVVTPVVVVDALSEKLSPLATVGATDTPAVAPVQPVVAGVTVTAFPTSETPTRVKVRALGFLSVKESPALWPGKRAPGVRLACSTTTGWSEATLACPVPDPEALR